MLGIPANTPYDLKFHALGIPVRIHPLFWLAAALLGWNGEEPSLTLVWVVCVLISVLVHEFGHGLVARGFGYRPFIVLYGMGGLCVSEAERQTRWQRLAVLISGPGAGFVLFGLLYAVAFILVTKQVPINRTGEQFIRFMLTINLFWGLVNLLPIYPLDGGQITGVIATGINSREGMRWTHVISILAGGGVAAWFFSQRLMLTALFFVLFALMNFQILQALHQHARYGSFDEDDADWWKR
jgi:Zn-dependent protease